MMVRATETRFWNSSAKALAYRNFLRRYKGNKKRLKHLYALRWQANPVEKKLNLKVFKTYQVKGLRYNRSYFSVFKDTELGGCRLSYIAVMKMCFLVANSKNASYAQATAVLGMVSPRTLSRRLKFFKDLLTREIRNLSKRAKDEFKYEDKESGQVIRHAFEAYELLMMRALTIKDSSKKN